MDANFFASINAIDYSLLIGVHQRDNCSESENLRQTYLNCFECYEDRKDGKNALRSTCGEFVYFFGIIDTLTYYKY
jgi:hypothetical protein